MANYCRAGIKSLRGTIFYNFFLPAAEISAAAPRNTDLAVPWEGDGETKKVNNKSEHSYLFFSIYFLASGRNFGGAGNTDLAIARQRDGETVRAALEQLAVVGVGRVNQGQLVRRLRLVQRLYLA